MGLGLKCHHFCCSNLYKLCSKIVCERLNTVIDKILSPEQTGFSKNKRIFSTITSLLESCNLALKTNSPGFAFCADYQKAFDLINHKYLLSVFKFFGFGDFFVNLIKTILSGKKASIQFETNSNSCNSFLMESGTGQGGAISVYRNSPPP